MLNYDEYNEMLKNKFKASIQTDDKKIHDIIYNSLVIWYEKKYSKIIKQAFEETDESKIISISKQINRICNLSDISKLEEIVDCEQINELMKISIQTFELAKLVNQSHEKLDINVDEYLNKINELEKSVPIILKSKFNHIKSECMLDLDYIKKDGNTNSYSIRLYNYLKLYKMNN